MLLSRNKLALIGLGNYLMKDEGFGLRVIPFLFEELKGLPVDLVEGGTPGLNLLHEFQEREALIFLDAGYCGQAPGEFARFTPDDVKSNKLLAGLSLHEFDLMKFIKSAEKLGFVQNTEIVVFCMQVKEIALSEEFSPEVQAGLPAFVEAVCAETRGMLEKWSAHEHPTSIN
ncbi:MAG: hydrogenase maturation protease [Spirochaetales bacterium]|nr:hydrogenase maturation protease [Spirochaetales bacterium]